MNSEVRDEERIISSLRNAPEIPKCVQPINRTDRKLEIERKKRGRMKRETESRRDELVKRIGELAKESQKLARVAVQQYSAEVEAILKAQRRDSMRIERCLDGMLDFGFDDGMVMLYKKLCRHYFDINPEAAVSYVHAYREMWDGRWEKYFPLSAREERNDKRYHG